MNKEIENIKPTLNQWAKNLPYIKRLWVYGSRITRHHDKTSDIDIAIEINATMTNKHLNEDAYTYFFYEKEKLKNNLQQHLPWKVHLCSYNPDTARDLPIKYGNVKKEIDRYGLLVYENNEEGKTDNEQLFSI